MNTTIDWTTYPGLPFAFNFEKNFDVDYHVKWFHENWPLTVHAGILYLFCVFFGVNYMKNRQPYKLQSQLALWSLSLSIFSIMAALRLVPTSLYLIQTKGWFVKILKFHHKKLSSGFIGSAIDGSYNNDIRVKCWAWLFSISKVPEFLDTFFIVTRKQKLIFLHWYHHFLTAPFCALVFPEMTGAMIHYQAMNAAIHSMMYTYYTLKAMKIRVPSSIAMFITTSQIIQMILGTIWSVSLLWLRISGQDVNMSYRSLVFGAIMYTSYLALFVKFFLDSYFGKPAAKVMANGKKKE